MRPPKRKINYYWPIFKTRLL